MLRIRGDDAWVGRHVCKDFLVDNDAGPAIKKPFYGTVTAVEEDEDHTGYRLFKVLYTDGEDEWLPVEDLFDILMPEDAQVISAQNLVCLSATVIFTYIIMYVSCMQIPQAQPDAEPKKKTKKKSKYQDYEGAPDDAVYFFV